MAGHEPQRVAVLAHGAGSTAEFLIRAFGPALAEAGWRLEPIDDRSGSVEVVRDRLALAVRQTGAGLVGGVSLGAHAAATWASRAQPGTVTGLLLVMPAWTGRPGPVAAASTQAATRIESVGVARALADVRDGSWVGEELARAWPTYGDGLADALSACARSPGPTRRELAGITAPTGIVGLRGDPFHPVAVAQSWAAQIPRSGLVELEHSDPQADLLTLGHAAVAALERAQRFSGSR